MKRVFLIAVILLLAFGFTGCKKEIDRPLKLGSEGGDWKGLKSEEYPDGFFQTYLLPKFTRETGLEVTYHEYKGEAAQNTKIMDSDLVSDYPPDIISAYGGRINKYSNYRYGVDLKKYLPAKFLAQFKESALRPFQSEGIQYALPISGWATTMIVNMDLVERAGASHLIPEDDLDRSWTTDEFMELMEAVKALDDGSYGFFVIAAVTGGDYWILNLFAGFGAEYYRDGKIEIASPEGVRALAFIKSLQDQGYAPPGAAGLSHVEMIEMFQKGKIAAIGGVPGWTTLGDTGFKNGLIDKPFKGVVMEYPHVPGLNGTPVCYGPDAVMIIDNGDEERIKKAAKLIQYVAGPEAQATRQGEGKYSPLKQSPNLFEDDLAWNQVKNISEVNGVWDMGIGHRYYSDVRQIWIQHLQGALTGELTPQEALEKFQAHANEMIGK